MKSTIIFIFLLTNFVYGQTRQEYSADTKTIFSKLDSLLNLDAELEFRTVGDCKLPYSWANLKEKIINFKIAKNEKDTVYRKSNYCYVKTT